MKQLLKYILVGGFAAAAATSCKDVLYPECMTAPTSSYLFSSPEGLQKAVVGLYSLDRELIGQSEGSMFCVSMMDFCTDLMVTRGGTAMSLAKLDNNTAATSEFATYWRVYYAVIGRANEIISAAREIGLDDPDVAQSYGEACVFRARSYFMLWQRFERLYLNTEPTTVDNAFGREFKAASTEEVFAQIKEDLEEAITYLDWKVPGAGTGNVEYGRLTKAVAKHIRAQVALWEKDWDRAAKEVDEIFANGTYKMDKSAAAVFSGANLTSDEVLYSFQFSNQPGGGNTLRNGVVNGHTIPLVVTPSYFRQKGFVNSTEYGGYGWGRVFPNTYLLGLYDKEHDKRYTELFQHEWVYNDPSFKDFGQVCRVSGSSYLSNIHPSSTKYYDKWTHTDDPNFRSSFKDLIVYRLAETALIGAEAYFRKEGGSSAKALVYYNMTWERAGNARFEGPLTQDILLEETARELHFEGVRWAQLKRLGLLEERVRLHGGDSKAEDPLLPSDYCEVRTNFKSNRDTRWPIPQTQLDLMPGYGQNEGWN